MKICLYDSGIGAISFLRTVLKENLGNDYYLFLDQANFPYGEKSDRELRSILEKNVAEIRRGKYDYLLICCNTMSRIFLENPIPVGMKVRTILEYNLQNVEGRKLLVTTNLSQKIASSVDGKRLAEDIEKGRVKRILEALDEIRSPIVLGCTHYHFLEPLMDYYGIDYKTRESQIFAGIETTDRIRIFARKENYEVVKKFIKTDIKIY